MEVTTMKPDYDPWNVIACVEFGDEPVSTLLTAYDGDPNGPADELLAHLGVNRSDLVDCLERLAAKTEADTERFAAVVVGAAASEIRSIGRETAAYFRRHLPRQGRTNLRTLIIARVRSSLSGRRRPGTTRTTRTGGTAAASVASAGSDPPPDPPAIAGAGSEERWDPARGVPFRLWQLEAAFELAASRRDLADAEDRRANADANLVILRLLQAGALEAWIAHALRESDGGES
jgi:hypothetical protein